MSRFKIGDRVIARVSHPSGNESIYVGDQGVVCGVYEHRIGVRWDIEVKGGHDCSGLCDSWHGWNVFDEELDFPPESEAEFDIEEESFIRALVYA